MIEQNEIRKAQKLRGIRERYWIEPAKIEEHVGRIKGHPRDVCDLTREYHGVAGVGE